MATPATPQSATTIATLPVATTAMDSNPVTLPRGTEQVTVNNDTYYTPSASVQAPGAGAGAGAHVLPTTVATGSTVPIFSMQPVSAAGPRLPQPHAPASTTSTTSTMVTTAINTTQFSSQVGTFIPTYQVAAGVGIHSVPPLHSLMPTWSTASVARPRLHQPVLQPVSTPAGLDLSDMARQLSVLQSQMSMIQGYHGQGQVVTQAGASWHQGPWNAPVHVVCTALPTAHSASAPYMGMSSNSLGHSTAPPWQQPIIPQYGPPRAQVNTRSTPESTQLLVANLRPVDSFSNIMDIAPLDNIPEKIVKTAVAGTFVDIESFLKTSTCVLDEQTDLQTLIDPNTGTVSYRIKKPQKDIDNLITWIEGFLNYQKLMVAAHGLVSSVMIEYVHYIMESERKYVWPCVYAFDIRHREAMSGKHINFMDLDPTMMVRILDPLAVKSNARCLSCKSDAHSMEECPLNAANMLPPSAPPPSGAGGAQMRGTAVVAEENDPKIFASPLTPTNAPFTSAIEDTYVLGVQASFHSESVSSQVPATITQMARPPNRSLRSCIQFWDYWLTPHPNKDFVQKVLTFIMEGIPIGYTGPEDTVISDNWPSALKYSHEVTDFVNSNIEEGNIGGPLSKPYPKGYRSSPLGAFMRNSTSKIRVIHDLSWPPSRSVNDHISSKEFTLNYVTVDQAADLTLHFKDPWLVKIDLKSAFLSCP